MITRVITSSPVKVTGTTPGDQRFESFLEEEFLVLARFRRDVESFERPTESIPWRDKTGKLRRYTPDVVVRFKPTDDQKKGRVVIYEVKPDFEKEVGTPASRLPRREDEEENELKWAAAERWAEARGWKFKVVRSTSIRGSYLQNAKFLVKYVERQYPDHGADRLLSILGAEGPMALQNLMQRAEPDRTVRAAIYPTLYVLIVRGEIDVDLSQPLCNGSVLKVPNET
jgi:hypothetical protein